MDHRRLCAARHRHQLFQVDAEGENIFPDYKWICQVSSIQKYSKLLGIYWWFSGATTVLSEIELI